MLLIINIYIIFFLIWFLFIFIFSIKFIIFVYRFNHSYISFISIYLPKVTYFDIYFYNLSLYLMLYIIACLFLYIYLSLYLMLYIIASLFLSIFYINKGIILGTDLLSFTNDPIHNPNDDPLLYIKTDII